MRRERGRVRRRKRKTSIKKSIPYHAGKQRHENEHSQTHRSTLRDAAARGLRLQIAVLEAHPLPGTGEVRNRRPSPCPAKGRGGAEFCVMSLPEAAARLGMIF